MPKKMKTLLMNALNMYEGYIKNAKTQSVIHSLVLDMG